ncbi:MAG: hypothetical protein SGJ10_10925 [Bacteroidota bacterium]|nr:hypothetical protein [Bacteroidota bacterium]
MMKHYIKFGDVFNRILNSRLWLVGTHNHGQRGSSFLFFIISIISINAAQAQPVKKPAASQTMKIEMNIGDSIWLGKPSEPDHFEYIDMITKTRIPDTNLTYDSITGAGFYTYFFENGDMDGKRLPAFYQGEPMIVATSIKAKDKKTGEDRMVIIAWINKEKMQVAWIEIGSALENGEVKLRR